MRLLYKDPENWIEDIRTNVQGTANVVKASKRSGVRQLIYFQTAFAMVAPSGATDYTGAPD